MISKEIMEAMEIDDVTELCVSIDVGEIVYPLCFIRKETLKYLIVDSTGDDGCERVVIISKDKIVSVNVVYEQDISFEEVKRDLMFR